LTIHIEHETQSERIERCDHRTTEPLAGLSSVSVCSACGKDLPDAVRRRRRIVPKADTAS